MELLKAFTETELNIFVGTFYKGSNLNFEKSKKIFELEFGFEPNIKESERAIETFDLVFKRKNAPDFFENEHFIFLKELQDTGVTNMFLAGEFISREFGLEPSEAKEVLKFYMKNYNELYFPERLI
jgi:hypothetical protein